MAHFNVRLHPSRHDDPARIDSIHVADLERSITPSPRVDTIELHRSRFPHIRLYVLVLRDVHAAISSLDITGR